MSLFSMHMSITNMSLWLHSVTSRLGVSSPFCGLNISAINGD